MSALNDAAQARLKDIGYYDDGCQRVESLPTAALCANHAPADAVVTK